ncbi:hypothetical protein H4219_004967 [Mycoemilia scoparia]|uniref:PAS domain-containing protein n=1 Tax=Mycoemilia scoparia TaxID=417184 RepID=A0A9W7ZY01_9FUNG|nr:hypothetical protein H4219_004967 [Mycoemilia scoparia]
MHPEYTTLWIHDNTPECNILWCSNSVSDCLGWKPEEMIGKTAEDFVPAHRTIHYRRAIARNHLQDALAWQFNIETLCKDGSYATLSCVCFNCQNIVIAIASPTDLSDTKLTRIQKDGETKQEDWVSSSQYPNIPPLEKANVEQVQMHGVNTLFPKADPMDRIHYMPIPEQRGCFILRSDPINDSETTTENLDNMFGRANITRDWKIEFASQTMENLLGFDGSELISRSFLKCVYVEDMVGVADSLDKAMSSHRVHSLSFRVCPEGDPLETQKIIPVEGLVVGSFKNIVLLMRPKARTRNDIRSMIEHKRMIRKRQQEQLRRERAAATAAADHQQPPPIQEEAESMDESSIDYSLYEDPETDSFSLCDIISSDPETSAAEGFWAYLDESEFNMEQELQQNPETLFRDCQG